MPAAAAAAAAAAVGVRAVAGAQPWVSTWRAARSVGRGPPLSGSVSPVRAADRSGSTAAGDRRAPPLSSEPELGSRVARRGERAELSAAGRLAKDAVNSVTGHGCAW